MSQTGQQIITIPILHNISSSKGNQTMEIWSVNTIQHEKFFFFKNHGGRKTSFRPLSVFFKKFRIN